MAKPKSNESPDISIVQLNEGHLTMYIKGQTPLIYNAMSLKVKQGLLLPKKKTTAERASSLKHDPVEEFRSSVYRCSGGPTLLGFPAVAFKKALASAALDLGGAKRAQIDRLVWAIGEMVPVFGIPKLKMDVVRSADINRTPDIRTRAVLTDWCCQLTLSYVKPVINETIVGNLLAAAGMIRGIGDFRQEKGAGNYGQFILTNDDDKSFAALVKSAGRSAQVKALDVAEAYDNESAELLFWWNEEVRRRGHEDLSASKRSAKAKKANGHDAEVTS